jgi:DNA polymerase-3 subunit alpha
MPKTPFTHLHVHTHYSLLDGLGKIDDLLHRAQDLGMDSIAITDHGVMYGAVEFYLKAKKMGIKPIIGCEMYVAPNGMENKRPRIDDDRFHLVLLAKNEQGYKNLMKLATEAHLRGYYYKPRIDLDLLKEHAEGLIGMTACVEGEIPSLVLSNQLEQAAKRALFYQEILGKGNFFLELQHLPNFANQQIANEGLIKISKETGIPLVATADIHYVHPEDNEVQDILVCIQTNRKVTDTNRLSMKENQLHLKSPEEMYAAFKHVPEALENTQKIAAMCNVEIEMDVHRLPNFPVPANYTPQTYLTEMCEQGLHKRYGENITQQHRERLVYELSVIEKMGFAGYFLIVQDFVNWAKNNEVVVGPGRGSAAGSIIAYLTGITNVDPIKYNLLFERFLNPDRISLPDIDMDFADTRRDDVLEYVRNKYGRDHVAQIITFGTMAAKAAIRDAGRVLGVEYSYCDALSKMVPNFANLKDALQQSAELAKEYKTNPDAKRIIDAAMRLEGVARHASVHACGVVITPEPVVEYSPLQYMTGKEGAGIVTQYSASSKSSFVEKIGLVKMDFLGLRNLTIIENALRVIKKTTGDIINIDELPMDDLETYKLLQRGDTTGIFQLESSGMKRYLKQLKPTVFEDIIAMVALYRPGPMEWIPDFIDGKHGRKQARYLHPKLKPILENTYGVAVYQEQVMQIAREVAGFTPGEADVLRKAMGKKIAELIQEEKIKFINGCVANNINKELAEKIFAFIEPFAGYGFNRSHAACYALIGYQTAYLKAHYPTQFMAALLNSDKDDIDRIAIEIEEARGMGIEVLSPDINESFRDFSVILSTEATNEKKNEKIRFGLEAIKGVGKNIAEQIIAERKSNGPYKDVIDLVERVQDKDLNKKSLEALAMSGALDNLIERNKLLQNIEPILNYAKQQQKNLSSGQFSLFGFGKEQIIETPKITLNEVEPATKRQMLTWEKELMGLYISDHPLRGYQEYFSAKATQINQLSSSQINTVITVGGIITKLTKIITRSGKLMYFAMLEDGLGKIEALVFPKTLDKNPEIWIEESILLLKGKLSDKDGQYKLLCEEAILVNEEELEKFKKDPGTGPAFPMAAASRKNNSHQQIAVGKPFTKKELLEICLEENCDNSILKEISKIICDAQSGHCRVYLRSHDHEGKLETPYRIKHDDQLILRIKKMVGEENVVIKEM